MTCSWFSRLDPCFVVSVEIRAYPIHFVSFIGLAYRHSWGSQQQFYISMDFDKLCWPVVWGIKPALAPVKNLLREFQPNLNFGP
jgi:hypothetical protein